MYTQMSGWCSCSCELSHGENPLDDDRVKNSQIAVKGSHDPAADFSLSLLYFVVDTVAVA